MPKIEEFRTLIPKVGEIVPVVPKNQDWLKFLAPTVTQNLIVQKQDLDDLSISAKRSGYLYTSDRPLSPYDDLAEAGTDILSVHYPKRKNMGGISYGIHCWPKTDGEYVEDGVYIGPDVWAHVDFDRDGDSSFKIQTNTANIRGAWVGSGLWPILKATYAPGDDRWRFVKHEPAVTKKEVEYERPDFRGEYRTQKCNTVEIIHDDPHFKPSEEDLQVQTLTDQLFWQSLYEIEKKAAEVPMSHKVAMLGGAVAITALQKLRESRILPPEKASGWASLFRTMISFQLPPQNRFQTFHTSKTEDIAALQELGVDPFEFRD